jgi:hypothetical protein
MTADLALRAVSHAVALRGPAGTVVHSDRGSQTGPLSISARCAPRSCTARWAASVPAPTTPRWSPSSACCRRTSWTDSDGGPLTCAPRSCSGSSRPTTAGGGKMPSADSPRRSRDTPTDSSRGLTAPIERVTRSRGSPGQTLPRLGATYPDGGRPRRRGRGAVRGLLGATLIRTATALVHPRAAGRRGGSAARRAARLCRPLRDTRRGPTAALTSPLLFDGANCPGRLIRRRSVALAAGASARLLSPSPHLACTGDGT